MAPQWRDNGKGGKGRKGKGKGSKGKGKGGKGSGKGPCFQQRDFGKCTRPNCPYDHNVQRTAPTKAQPLTQQQLSKIIGNEIAKASLAKAGADGKGDKPQKARLYDKNGDPIPKNKMKFCPTKLAYGKCDKGAECKFNHNWQEFNWSEKGTVATFKKLDGAKNELAPSKGKGKGQGK